MKKIVSLVLVVGLAATLAGCGSTSSKPAATEPAKTAAVEPIKMGRVDYAAHGTKAVAIGTVAAVQGDKIVGASIDDYQFMSTDVAKGIPNSDKDFNKGYADPKNVLASKRVNAEYYGGNMKTKAGSTIPYEKNLDAIEDFATGKTISELEKIIKDTPKEKLPVDTITGSTLADTQGYLTAILEAAKAAK